MTDTSEPYADLSPCQTLSEGKVTLRDQMRMEDVVVEALCESCRRLAMFHDCSAGCYELNVASSDNHGISAFSGGHF